VTHQPETKAPGLSDLIGGGGGGGSEGYQFAVRFLHFPRSTFDSSNIKITALLDYAEIRVVA
jgi:hypothetical protein